MTYLPKTSCLFISAYRREKLDTYYDEEIKSREEYNQQNKGLFDKEKLTEKTSVLNSDKVHYMKLETSSNLTQHSSFPWEVYFDNMQHLEDKKMKKGKSLLMFPNGFQMSAFDETFGEDYNYHLDDVPGLLDTVIHSFTFRKKFSNPGKNVLTDIAHDYRMNNPKKFKNKKDITFVGIHQRRGDHLSFQEEGKIGHLSAGYFLEAMEIFRERFRRVVFVYVSDDLEWGRKKLERRIKSKDFYIAGSLQDPNLKGEDFIYIILFIV